MIILLVFLQQHKPKLGEKVQVSGIWRGEERHFWNSGEVRWEIKISFYFSFFFFFSLGLEVFNISCHNRNKLARNSKTWHRSFIKNATRINSDCISTLAHIIINAPHFWSSQFQSKWNNKKRWVGLIHHTHIHTSIFRQ